ncbi:MAG: DUF87 domain-containing protein [Candidatus Vogelbacteria bacterium]|nr:DUF87 domain-containing protein [Candidatus Vogelbacteria bacterium]
MSIEAASGKRPFSPEEELAYLRAEVARKEKEIAARGESVPIDIVAREALLEYADSGRAAEVANEPEQPEGAIVLNLEADNNDATMAELIQVAREKGLKRALRVVGRLGNDHIQDDFHRFLVQYVLSGYSLPGIDRETPLRSALYMTLFRITLPAPEKEERARPLKELLTAMEQFIIGMGALGTGSSGKRFYSLEVGIKGGSGSIGFYAAIPNEKVRLFEQQMRSVFPHAKLEPQPNDYNIFVEDGYVAASELTLSRNASLSLKTFMELDHDPLNALLNTFSALVSGYGAALQFVMSPPDARFGKRYQKIERALAKGMSFDEAQKIPETAIGELAADVWKTLFTRANTDEKKEAAPDTDTIERIKEKAATPISPVNARLLVSAPTEERAEAVLSDCEASFLQFAHAKGNRIEFQRAKPRALRSLARSFSFRLPDPKASIPLSAREIASLIHFPVQDVSAVAELSEERAQDAPAPPGLPSDGTLLGVNRYRGKETRIYLTDEDRLRHLYCIGQTGTGKSTLLKNIIIQDIQNGHGVCMIDPHGNDIIDVLAHIPPERYGDVIYFDPAYLERVQALNMLEYDTRFPEQKTFVVNELLGIFRKLYGEVPESMGPAFEQYFRNAALLVMEDPSTGNTMLDIGKVLADSAFRKIKLARCHNPVVKQFWEEIATKAGGEASLVNIVPYITNKFDDFTANEIMRPIIGQEKSSFNFRNIMDSRKILLVNLSKGRLGERNANLLGLIIVGKFLMAALSRADSIGKDLPPFYLHIDEFQNVTTNSIAQILSEARKYKLGLTIAHQFIAQISEDVMRAVFGNVGSIMSFRVGAQDAEALVPQFDPVFEPAHLMNITNFNCHIRLLARGVPQKPFTVRIERPDKGNRGAVEELKRLSYLAYGRPRAEVEKEIQERFFSAD